MLRVFDQNLNFRAEIDDFGACLITRKYLGIETLELTIPVQSLNAPELQKHCVLWMGARKVFEILHREIDQQDTSTLKITAFGFGKTLAKRITVPPVGEAYETASGSRDEIVKQYIAGNLISPADPQRVIAYLENAPVQAGASITDQTRYQNLNDEVIRVLSSDDLGYFFDLNMAAGKIVFDSYAGVDRTVGNAGGNSPAIFSVAYDNIKSQHYVQSVSSCLNQMYVGGQGEGELRTIVAVGNYSGAERFEVFIDARDTHDAAELANRGLSEQVPEINTFEAEINPVSNLVYDRDYTLGDTVNIQSPELNLSLATRITEVKEYYQQGQPMELDITFGDSFPSILSEVKLQTKKINKLATI